MCGTDILFVFLMITGSGVWLVIERERLVDRMFRYPQNAAVRDDPRARLLCERILLGMGLAAIAFGLFSVGSDCLW